MLSPTLRGMLYGLTLVSLLGTLRPMHAQVLYGSVVGNVKDPSGAPLPGALVTLTSVETKQARDASTSDDGGYNFATVPAGNYELKISKAGFATSTSTGVMVAADDILRLDLTLRVGAVSESIEVNASSALIETDRTDVHNELTAVQLDNLPLSYGRNYQSLFITQPGFAGIQSSYNSTPSNPSKALVFNVNGASFNINNTRIDGAQSINVWLPHESAYVPTLDAVATVNAVTANFDAETGLAGGAAIYVYTKSGTNDIHGSVFWNHNNQHLDARPFFLPFSQSKPKFIYNDFGGSMGGPIKKEKLFYFASYESTNDRESAFYLATVPTAAIKSGNMQGQNNQIYDPATGDFSGANRTPFPDQIVPVSRQDPIARKLASMTPLPNLPGNLLSSNYYASGSYIFDRRRLDAKMDWKPGTKFTTFVRFGFLNYNMNNPPIFGDLGGQQVQNSGGNPGHGYGNTFTVTAGGTYLVTPQFIIDAYVGWARLGTNVETPGLNQKAGLDLGIPGTNGPAHYQGGLPRFAVNSYEDIGTPGTVLPYYRSDPATNYVVNGNWNKGRHDIRFGLDVSRLAMNQIQAEGGYAAGMGGFVFSGGPTSAVGAGSNQFNSYAAFLLGLANQTGKNTIFAPNAGCPEDLCGAETTRAWRYGIYARDRWNVLPSVTLSYGLRWEYFPMPKRIDQGIGIYNPDTNLVAICGYQAVPDGCGIRMSKRLFAPRVGVAWRITNSMVFRAGYGITNDPYSLDRPFKYNYPTLLIQTYDAPNSYQWVTTLQQGIPAVQLPDVSNGYIPLPAAYVTTTINNKAYNRGYIQSWNFTLQKELKWGFAGQAGYVATRATDFVTAVNMNAGQVPGLGMAGQPLLAKFGRTAATTLYEPVGTNQYNSLQARLERRFAHGMQFSANYTWSKAVGMAANNDSGLRENAPAYWSLNRAVLNYDRTQNLQLQGMYELPFGKGKRWLSSGGLGTKLAGGWRLNSIASFMTGLPFFVTASGSSLNMPGSTQRADLVNPDVQIFGNVNNYFDPLAFKPVTDVRFGNLGFNSLRGPGVVNMDLSVSRDFPITERFKAQFRFESSNFTNTPHFNLPGTNVSNLVLNPDGTVKNLAGFTQITQTQNLGRDFDERRIQFGLRITF